MDYVKEIDSETNAGLSFASFAPSKPIEKIDKAGVNLNPFSGNFDNLNKKEKEKLQ